MAMTVACTGRSVVSQINVTPLADVMLVLLIIFMVVTPLLRTPVPVSLPRTDTAAEQADSEKATVITLTDTGALYFDNVPLPEELLAERVASRAAAVPARPVLLRADDSADYGKVLFVMSVCRRAGVAEVALITEPRRHEGGH